MRSAIAAFAVATTALVATESSAQVVYVAGYAPAPAVVVGAPTVAYRPVSPVVAYSPVVSYGSVVAAPAPTPVVVARPTVVGGAVVTTRYRPFLGGAVSRVRYRYAPTTVVTPIY